MWIFYHSPNDAWIMNPKMKNVFLTSVASANAEQCDISFDCREDSVIVAWTVMMMMMVLMIATRNGNYGDDDVRVAIQETNSDRGPSPSDNRDLCDLDIEEALTPIKLQDFESTFAPRFPWRQTKQPSSLFIFLYQSEVRSTHVTGDCTSGVGGDFRVRTKQGKVEWGGLIGGSTGRCWDGFHSRAVGNK